VFWPCPSEDHPGTPRLFEGGAFPSRRQGALRGGGVPRERRPLDDSSRPTSPPAGWCRTTFRDPDPADRALVDQYPEPRSRSTRASPTRWDRADDWVTVATRARRDHAAGSGGAHHPARHGLHPVPLAGGAEREPADPPHPRPEEQDPRVQGLRLPPAKGGRAARVGEGLAARRRSQRAPRRRPLRVVS
jgi:hypothetical protein